MIALLLFRDYFITSRLRSLYAIALPSVCRL